MRVSWSQGDWNHWSNQMTGRIKLRSATCRLGFLQNRDSVPWWHHQMETFCALLAGYSPITGEIPSQKPVTLGFAVSFDLCLNKRLSKQSWSWWFETPSRLLWRQCNVGVCLGLCRIELISSKINYPLLLWVTITGHELSNHNKPVSHRLHYSCGVLHLTKDSILST